MNSRLPKYKSAPMCPAPDQKKEVKIELTAAAARSGLLIDADKRIDITIEVHLSVERKEVTPFLKGKRLKVKDLNNLIRNSK